MNAQMNLKITLMKDNCTWYVLVRESDEKRENRSDDEDDDGGGGGNNNNNKEKWDPQWHLFPRGWLLGGERC